MPKLELSFQARVRGLYDIPGRGEVGARLWGCVGDETISVIEGMVTCLRWTTRTTTNRWRPAAQRQEKSNRLDYCRYRRGRRGNRGLENLGTFSEELDAFGRGAFPRLNVGRNDVRKEG